MTVPGPGRSMSCQPRGGLLLRRSASGGLTQSRRLQARRVPPWIGSTSTAIPAVNVPPAPSVLTRLLIRSWEYRHPGAWMGVRLACGIFNVGLGILLLFYGFWVGRYRLPEPR